jgi:hypothetical protein
VARCAPWAFAGLAAAGLALASEGGARDEGAPPVATPLVALAANDLGMHCTQQDFSEFLILPPFNTVHVQVIDRTGEHPQIVKDGVDISYTIFGNTRSFDKTNWWAYDEALLGADFAPDVGLTGNGMSGVMTRTPSGDFAVTGIPITPIDDNGLENPYPMATITVLRNGLEAARTQAVVPVSWEINCNLCHSAPGISAGLDLLRAHDRLHGTTLEFEQPVFCAGCHGDPALGAAGDPDLPMFSAAMHGAHADRMGLVNLENECYACHPGMRTQCQRDIHASNGVVCIDCHGGMAAVGDPARMPWADEPRCGDCHTRTGFEFEQPGVLYRDSVGHGGVHCYACHGSPHAITPTTTEQDNLQAINLQGHAGVIDNCSVCHSQPEGDPFFHSTDD